MKTSINTSVDLNLTLQELSILQEALTYYVENAPLPSGSPARDLMWAITTEHRKILVQERNRQSEPLRPQVLPSVLPTLPLDEVIEANPTPLGLGIAVSPSVPAPRIEEV
jgi:hypothetical protein